MRTGNLEECAMPTEKFTVSGDELVARVKKLIHEGNIRRVRVLQGGKVILEIPLSIGAPAAAIGIAEMI
jgi:CBS domain-containing protein